MKKYWLVLILLTFCFNLTFAQNLVGLDDGIEDAANFLTERIPVGTFVAVFNFSSDSEKLSKYIVDELTIALTNTGMEIIDRNNLDEVNREIYHGFTGAVNDDTAQSYGKDVGVQTVILGSITKSGDYEYRFRVQAIVVETKRIQAGRTFNIRLDEKLLSLLDISIHNEYRFTNKEKISAGFKNILFGWGSFQMGDPWGGASVLVGEGGSLAVFLIGLFKHAGAYSAAQDAFSKSDFAVDYVDGGGRPGGIWEPPPPGVIYSEDPNNSKTGFYYNQTNYNRAISEKEAELKRTAEGLIIGGSVGLALSWTWGFIRPFIYDKPVAVQKAANVIDHLNIGIIPVSNGNMNLNVSFRYNF